MIYFIKIISHGCKISRGRCVSVRPLCFSYWCYRLWKKKKIKEDISDVILNFFANFLDPNDFIFILGAPPMEC